jgi:hypothetical protein
MTDDDDGRRQLLYLFLLPKGDNSTFSFLRLEWAGLTTRPPKTSKNDDASISCAPIYYTNTCLYTVSKLSPLFGLEKTTHRLW